MRNDASFFCRFVVALHSSESSGRRRHVETGACFGRVEFRYSVVYRGIGRRGGTSAGTGAATATKSIGAGAESATASVAVAADVDAPHFRVRGGTGGRPFAATDEVAAGAETEAAAAETAGVATLGGRLRRGAA